MPSVYFGNPAAEYHTILLGDGGNGVHKLHRAIMQLHPNMEVTSMEIHLAHDFVKLGSKQKIVGNKL